MLYYFSNWPISHSRVNLRAVSRDHLGKRRADPGAWAQAEELWSSRCARGTRRLKPNSQQRQWSGAEVLAGLCVRDFIVLYNSPYHQNYVEMRNTLMSF